MNESLNTFGNLLLIAIIPGAILAFIFGFSRAASILLLILAGLLLIIN